MMRPRPTTTAASRRLYRSPLSRHPQILPPQLQQPQQRTTTLRRRLPSVAPPPLPPQIIPSSQARRPSPRLKSQQRRKRSLLALHPHLHPPHAKKNDHEALEKWWGSTVSCTSDHRRDLSIATKQSRGRRAGRKSRRND